MNIVLIGFKSVGKTTIGKQLASRLELPFIDTDKLVEQRYSVQYGIARSCASIYKQHGRACISAIEYQALRTLRTTTGAIIATGGGIILSPENVEILPELGHIVYLKASKATLKQRLLASKIPVFLEGEDPDEAFEQMYRERHDQYQRLAKQTVLVDERSAEQILDELIQW